MARSRPEADLPNERPADLPNDLPAEPPAELARPQPTRIEPVRDAAGRPLELAPPCGARWLRDADGGLTPADAQTAEAAGLAWAG